MGSFGPRLAVFHEGEANMKRRTASSLLLAVTLTATAAHGQNRGADIDRDGAIDLADLAAFERLLAQQHHRADLNRDGAIDLFDTLEFVRQMEDPGAGVDTTTPKLYLGVAKHWEDTAADGSNPWTNGHNFGPTELNYRWLDQSTLKIRSAKGYKMGTGGQLARADVTAGTSYVLRYGAGTSLTGQDALNAWAAAAITAINDSFADDPLKTTGGRLIQLDNESLMFSGWDWGRFMQGKLYDPPTQYSTISHIGDHTLEFMDWGEAFMDKLRESTAFPNDDFAWYNMPVARDLRRDVIKDPSDTDYEKHHPWTGDAYDVDELPESGNNDIEIIGTFPWWSVDEDLRPLLENADYIDGRLYANSMEDISGGPTKQEQQNAYFNGQMSRHLAIAADLVHTPPYMARVWFHDDRAASTLVSLGYLERFFTEAEDTNVLHTAVDGGRANWECACEIAGKTYGWLWNDLVVQAAYDATYITQQPVSVVTLVSATPDSGVVGTTVSSVSLRGSEFTTNSTVTVSGNGVTVSGQPVLVSSNELEVNLAIASGATLGAYDITVTQGNDSWTVEDAFHVYGSGPSDKAPAPHGFYDSRNALQNCVGPRVMSQGESIDITIAGDHFQDGCTVAISKLNGTGVTLGSVDFVDSRRVVVPVSLTPNATLGDWTIRVTNPDGQFAADWTLTITN